MTKEIILRDILAIERTKLANERTFLAYFRTSLVLLGTGLGIIKLEFLSEVLYMGYAAMALSLVILIIGIFRYRTVRKRVNSSYQ